MIGQQADVATVDPAAARQGLGGRNPEDRQGTDRRDPDAGQRNHHCHSADRSAGRVRAHRRSEMADGQWPYPSSPPTYYPSTGGALMTGLMWGVGIAAAGAMFGGWNWGYGGSGSYVNVNANRATNIDRNYNRGNVGAGGRWQYDGSHRKAVAYRHFATRRQFGQTVPAAISDSSFADSSKGELAAPAASVVPAAPAVPVASAAPAVSVERDGLVASAVPVVSVERVAPAARWSWRCRWRRPARWPWRSRWRRPPRWCRRRPGFRGGQSQRTVRCEPWPAGEPRIPARPRPAAKGGAAAQRRRRRWWPSRRRRRWPSRRRRRWTPWRRRRWPSGGGGGARGGGGGGRR